MPDRYACDICGESNDVGGKCEKCGAVMMDLGADDLEDEVPATESYDRDDLEKADDDGEESADDDSSAKKKSPFLETI